MKNRKIWAFLLVVSLLLTALAGCQNNAAPDSGSSQPDPTTASTTETVETTDTTEASNATETSESEVPLDTGWIATDWSTVFRYDKDGSSCLILLDLMLYEDGMGITVTSDWLVWETETGYLTDEVNASGKHEEIKPFSYTFDGECLSIAYHEYALDRWEDYTIVRSEDGSAFTLISADGEGSLAGMMFMPVGQILCSSWEKIFDTFSIDCGLFQPDNPQKSDSTEATQQVNPSGTSWIVGSWGVVNLNDFSEGGENMMFLTGIIYSFGADGSGSINDYGWIGRPGEEWEVAGKGYVETYFDYTLEGTTLTITHTGNEFEEYTGNDRFTLVYDVVRNQDGSMSWEPEGGGMETIYRQVDMNLSADELLAIFGWEENGSQS